MKVRDHLDGPRRRLESITETEYECVKYCLYGMKDEWLSAKILDIVEEKEEEDMSVQTRFFQAQIGSSGGIVSAS
jgi:hypothetical protein